MAISEACKYEIEENVDKACEEKSISKKQAFEDLEKFYNSIGVRIKFKGIETKYYRTKREKEKPSNEGSGKPVRTQTKPEVKIQLAKTAEAIKKGEVSDDDIKGVDNAIASAIKTGKSARRVGASTAAAVGTKRRVKGGGKSKPIDNYYRLNNHMKACIDGMTAWADGQMKPMSRDEVAEAKAILAKAASFIIQFARLGIDIEGIYETFYRKDYENENKKPNQARLDIR